jgi:hypothetical protein
VHLESWRWINNQLDAEDDVFIGVSTCFGHHPHAHHQKTLTKPTTPMVYSTGCVAVDSWRRGGSVCTCRDWFHFQWQLYWQQSLEVTGTELQLRSWKTHIIERGLRSALVVDCCICAQQDTPAYHWGCLNLIHWLVDPGSHYLTCCLYVWLMRRLIQSRVHFLAN